MPTLDGCVNQCGRLAKVEGVFGRRDQHRNRAVTLERAVEQPDRLRDRSRCSPVVERDRLAHQRVRVAARMIALYDGLGSELLGRRTEDRHVPARDECHFLYGGRETERMVVLRVTRELRARLLPWPAAL